MTTTDAGASLQHLRERLHDLKVWPAYYDALASGEKTFEVRRDDRGFQKGDRLLLRRYDPRGNFGSGRFTGEEITREISYVLTGGQFGIEPGFVVLALLTALEQKNG